MGHIMCIYLTFSFPVLFFSSPQAKYSFLDPWQYNFAGAGVHCVLDVLPTQTHGSIHPEAAEIPEAQQLCGPQG